MTDPQRQRTDAELEEAAFEALQRLYQSALEDGREPHGRVCAALLLGLYNGYRFPFDLTDLRLMPVDLFEDAMLVIRLDARRTRQEVHHYFDNGGARFEELFQRYGLMDVEKLKATGDGSPRPPAERGVIRSGDDVRVAVLACGDAPGYRDVSFTADCRVVGSDEKAVGPVRLYLRLGPADGLALAEHIAGVHAFAWRKSDKAPLDAEAGERRPPWLDRAPANNWPPTSSQGEDDPAGPTR